MSGEYLNDKPLMVGNGAQASNGLAASTVVKLGPGRVARVSVTTAGAAGAIHDCATVGAVGASTLVAVVPAAVGVLVLDWPFNNGLVYVPGAAQVASISFT